MATGNNLVAAFKQNTGAWLGPAVLVGAGDQIEVDAESLQMDVQYIENKGLSGAGTALPAAVGSKLVSGDLGPVPPYYRGLEVLLGLAFGTTPAPSQLGGSAAWRQGYTIKPDVTGKFGTLVFGGSNHPALREIPCAKVDGFTFEISKGDMGKFTFPIVGDRLNFNVGAAIANRIVASVQPADGPYTIAAQPLDPSYVTILIVDANASITEHVVTISGLNDSGDFVQEVYRKTVNGLSWTSTKQFSSIISVVASGTTGTAVGDTIVVGVLNGVNNPTTMASISLPTSADRELVTFPHLTLLIDDQSSGAAPATEIFVERLRVQFQRSVRRDRVTTKGKRFVDEPQSTDFLSASIAFDFPEWDSANHALLKDRLMGKKKKVWATLSGPVAASTFALELGFWLNNVQFKSGSVNAGGAGEIPYQVEGQAYRAISNPAGLPAWADANCLSATTVSLRTTAPIS